MSILTLNTLVNVYCYAFQHNEFDHIQVYVSRMPGLCDCHHFVAEFNRSKYKCEYTETSKRDVTVEN